MVRRDGEEREKEKGPVLSDCSRPVVLLFSIVRLCPNVVTTLGHVISSSQLDKSVAIESSALG